MLLFDVPDKMKVRVSSKRVYWVEAGAEKTVASDITWEGVTTDRYSFYKNIQRRLIINHDIGFFKAYGVWQKNVECKIIK